MEDRLIFLYHLVGVMEGRSKSGEPGVECPGRRPQGARQANPLCVKPESRKVAERKFGEFAVTTLTRKASKR